MSTFHVTSKMNLYDDLKLYKSISMQSSEIPEPSSNLEAGSILFKQEIDNTRLVPYGGALYVSVQTGVSNFEYRPMINKIEHGAGINITTDDKDPGKVSIALDKVEGDSGQIQFFKITVPKSGLQPGVNNNGITFGFCPGHLSGFLYKAYKSNNPTQLVDVAVYSSGNGDYVTIDFGSLENFNNLDSSVIVEVLPATVDASTSTATKTIVQQ